MAVAYISDPRLCRHGGFQIAERHLARDGRNRTNPNRGPPIANALIQIPVSDEPATKLLRTSGPLWRVKAIPRGPHLDLLMAADTSPPT